MRSRLLAGLWHRRGTHLVVTVAVGVVAGATAVATAGRDHRGAIAPLLVLAAGLLPAAGTALGSRRRHESALLRLRGLQVPGVASALAAEALLPVLVGGAAGVVFARLAGPVGWGPAVAAVAVAAVAVVGAMVLALREPLPVQLDGRARARGERTPARFLAILLIVGAVVAVVQRDAAGPDWVVFARPALVGLAGGIVAVGLVRAAARWSSGRAELRSLLVGRRLAAPRATGGLVLLVAGASLLGLATNVLLAVREWEEDTTIVTSAAPLVVPYAGEADDVLAATREADPEGRWLMAAVRVFTDDRPASRRVYLDTSRYARVVGDRLADTPAAEGSSAIRALEDAARAAEPEPMATGKFFTVSVATDSDRVELALLSVATDGVDGVGRQAVFVRIPPGRSTTTYVPLTRCPQGCRVLEIEVAVGPPCGAVDWARPRCRRPVVRIDRLDVGAMDLLDRAWQVAEPDDRPPGDLVAQDDALEVRPSVAGSSFLTTDRSAWAAPVVATTSVEWEEGPQAPTTSNLPRPALVVATVPALPLVAAGGTALDLPSSMLEGGSFGTSAEAWVLAREDTPDRVLASIGSPIRPGDVAADTIAGAGGDVAGDLLVLSLGAVLLGVLAAALPAPGLRRERTREHAALRLVGVGRSTLRATARRQAWWVAAAAGAGAAVGTALAVLAFAETLPVLRPQPAQLPLDTGLHPAAVAVAVATAAGTALLAGLWGTGGRGAASAPASLRSGEPA